MVCVYQRYNSSSILYLSLYWNAVYTEKPFFIDYKISKDKLKIILNIKSIYEYIVPLNIIKTIIC